MLCFISPLIGCMLCYSAALDALRWSVAIWFHRQTALASAPNLVPLLSAILLTNTYSSYKRSHLFFISPFLISFSAVIIIL
jgi:hypothetical protein